MSEQNRSSAKNKGVILPELSPPRIEQYQNWHLLAMGGMSEIWQASDCKDLENTIAVVKTPRRDRKNPALLSSYAAEVRALTALKNPAVVGLIDAQLQSTPPYLVLEYIAGNSGRQLLRERKQLAEATVWELVKELIPALTAMSEQGIVHRDIKPDNIIVSNKQQAILIDWSLSCFYQDKNIDYGETPVGTPQYMAPEQIECQPLDFRADFYALGATIWHLLTGHPPYPESDSGPTGVMARHLVGKFPDPREHNPLISSTGVSIINRLMQRQPAQRYQSVSELNAVLDMQLIALQSATDSKRIAALGEHKKIPSNINMSALTLNTSNDATVIDRLSEQDRDLIKTSAKQSSRRMGKRKRDSKRTASIATDLDSIRADNDFIYVSPDSDKAADFADTVNPSSEIIYNSPDSDNLLEIAIQGDEFTSEDLEFLLNNKASEANSAVSARSSQSQHLPSKRNEYSENTPLFSKFQLTLIISGSAILLLIAIVCGLWFLLGTSYKPTVSETTVNAAVHAVQSHTASAEISTDTIDINSTNLSTDASESATNLLTATASTPDNIADTTSDTDAASNITDNTNTIESIATSAPPTDDIAITTAPEIKETPALNTIDVLRGQEAHRELRNAFGNLDKLQAIIDKYPDSDVATIAADEITKINTRKEDLEKTAAEQRQQQEDTALAKKNALQELSNKQAIWTFEREYVTAIRARDIPRVEKAIATLAKSDNEVLTELAQHADKSIYLLKRLSGELNKAFILLVGTDIETQERPDKRERVRTIQGQLRSVEKRKLTLLVGKVRQEIAIDNLQIQCIESLLDTMPTDQKQIKQVLKIPPSAKLDPADINTPRDQYDFPFTLALGMLCIARDDLETAEECFSKYDNYETGEEEFFQTLLEWFAKSKKTSDSDE